jgi:hypothetical protein
MKKKKIETEQDRKIYCYVVRAFRFASDCYGCKINCLRYRQYLDEKKR